MLNMEQDQGSKPYLTTAIILAGVALLSRYYGLHLWHLSGDEHFTATLAAERYQSLVNPAYYALVVWSYQLFGDAVWISRVPALLLAVVSVAAFYYSWTRVVGRQVALYAAIITLFSAWHLWFSQYARFYIGVFLFSTLAYYYFYYAITSGRLSQLIAAMVCSLLAILFHATAVFVPMSAALAYLLLFFRPHNAASRRIITIYLALAVLGALVSSPFFITKVLGDWTGSGQTWGYGSLLIIPQVVKYLQLPIVAVALPGWWLLWQCNKNLAIYLTSCIALPLLFLMVAANFIAVRPDYVFYLLPLVILLAAFACGAVQRWLADRGLISYALLLVVLICLLPSFVSHFTAKRSLHLQDAMQFIDRHYQDGDQLFSFVLAVNQYTARNYSMMPFISYERDRNVNWQRALAPLTHGRNRTWILVTAKRKGLAPLLERWLRCNARLVWRKYATRIDYEVDGYELYLVGVDGTPSPPLSICEQGK